MKILIWPGHHDALDAAIKLFSHGLGTHAAFLRADEMIIHEAFYPQLRDRIVMPHDRRVAEVYEISGVTRQQHERFEKYFDYNLRRSVRYSIADLFRFALNRPNHNEHHTFCSRYIMHCLRMVLNEDQLPLVRLNAGDWASPRDLRISPRLHLLPRYLKS